MPVAEIIAIGTELLLGEMQDTNTCYLARQLRNLGIDLYRSSIIGDNLERIAKTIAEASQRADIILTSGGLGPTVDDPTRAAVAQAVGVELEFQPDLWEQIQERFKKYGRLPTENNRRQAYIPHGAIPLFNPVGTAPAFIFDAGEFIIASLPGVPRELENLFENQAIPYLRTRFRLHGMIKALVLHAAGVGESQIDELLGDLETATNPTVGLLAHPGQIDIRITAKADSELDADAMIASMAGTILSRLGDMVYGANETTLQEVIFSLLNKHSRKLTILESGFSGELYNRLQDNRARRIAIQTIPATITESEIHTRVQEIRQQHHNMVILVARLVSLEDRQLLSLSIEHRTNHHETTRFYGGPPALKTPWAVNTTLDFIRRNLPEKRT